MLTLTEDGYIDLSREQRVAHLYSLIERDDVLRHVWTDGPRGPHGYMRACLLAALSPEVGDTEEPTECPSWLMPLWLAEATPDLDDEVSDEAWPDVIRRYADLAGRWHVLNDEAWERARHAATVAVLREALFHMSGSVVGGHDGVDAALAWAASGEPEDNKTEVLAHVPLRSCMTEAGLVARTSRTRSLPPRDTEERAYDRMAAAILDAIEAEIRIAEGHDRIFGGKVERGQA